MSVRFDLGCLLVVAWIAALPAQADDFDRLEGQTLSGIVQGKGATAHERLTIAELGNLPSVLRGTRSALIVVKTDQGNPARLLVAPAFRKPPGGQGNPVPVLELERFATFEAGRATSRLARGRELLLFDGFRIDLDTGQVVPDGQGGDLQFVADANSSPRLEALGSAKMYTVGEPPLATPASATQPSPGRTVVPTDFAGRYRLFANGQWSGLLELKVDEQRSVAGQFRSDLNGAIFPVAGQVAADVPQKIRFTVTYPRAQHEFEGYLWTEGKGAMAGSVSMLAHSFGFFAIREGGHYAPEGEDVGPLTAEAERKVLKVIEIQASDRYILDGKTLDSAGLTDALRAAAGAERETKVLIHVPADLTYATVTRACAAVREAGIVTIRLAPTISVESK